MDRLFRTFLNIILHQEDFLFSLQNRIQTTKSQKTITSSIIMIAQHFWTIFNTTFRQKYFSFPQSPRNSMISGSKSRLKTPTKTSPYYNIVWGWRLQITPTSAPQSAHSFPTASVRPQRLIVKSQLKHWSDLIGDQMN